MLIIQMEGKERENSSGLNSCVMYHILSAGGDSNDAVSGMRGE